MKREQHTTGQCQDCGGKPLIPVYLHHRLGKALILVSTQLWEQKEKIAGRKDQQEKKERRDHLESTEPGLLGSACQAEKSITLRRRPTTTYCTVKGD